MLKSGLAKIMIRLSILLKSRSENEAGLGFACDRGVARRQLVWPLAVCGRVPITTKDFIK